MRVQRIVDARDHKHDEQAFDPCGDQLVEGQAHQRAIWLDALAVRQLLQLERMPNGGQACARNLERHALLKRGDPFRLIQDAVSEPRTRLGVQHPFRPVDIHTGWSAQANQVCRFVDKAVFDGLKRAVATRKHYGWPDSVRILGGTALGFQAGFTGGREAAEEGLTTATAAR